ncbi:ArsR/SmtB family transcription factor [Clostridium sp. UBA4548]|uniref:ArsR/SmtB family transcription factor n=1 Tax=Clostridium sp. UBA4548 TaxID=1946361 RepID=UPI0039C86FCB
MNKLDLLQVMKALADETRMRILYLLTHGDLCVCELELILDINQSNASRHLNKLTNAKILDYYKVGKYVYYKINEKAIKQYPFLSEIINNYSDEMELFKEDSERLKKYKDAGLNCDSFKDGNLILKDIIK